MESTTIAILCVVQAIAIASGYQAAIYIQKKIAMQNRKIRFLKTYNKYLQLRLERLNN